MIQMSATISVPISVDHCHLGQTWNLPLQLKGCKITKHCAKSFNNIFRCLIVSIAFLT